MSTPYKKIGFDFVDRFDEIENEIDRRFQIFNTVISQNIQYQVNTFADINQEIKKVKENSNVLNWYMKLKWYKKIWYSIRNINLLQEYKKQELKNKKL